ncbi:MAG: glycosyltransferase [Streptococcaceae bacterium]|nr:glycosyltransferase [Streptococcaceae bacterium]
MKKILIFGPTEHQGGIESFIELVISQLKGKAEFTIIQFTENEIVHSDYIRKSKLANIVKLEFKTGIKGKLSFFNKKLMKNFLSKNHFDVLHINENSPASFWLAKIALHNKIKVIYEAHNSFATPIKFNYTPRFLLKWIRFNQKRKLNRLNIVPVAVSDLAAKSMFYKNKEVVFIWNSIDTDKFEFSEIDRETLRNQMNISLDSKVGMFAARFVSQKNIFRALHIAEESISRGVLDFFVFIGDGVLSKDFNGELSKLSEKISTKILYLGKKDNIGRWYSFADLFLMTSFYEGFPFTVVEAQASGLPTILSDSVTKQVKCTDLLTYYSLEKGNAEWVSTISKVFEIESNRYERINYSKVVHNSKFSIENFKASLIELYQLNTEKK